MKYLFVDECDRNPGWKENLLNVCIEMSVVGQFRFLQSQNQLLGVARVSCSRFVVRMMARQRVEAKEKQETKLLRPFSTRIHLFLIDLLEIRIARRCDADALSCSPSCIISVSLLPREKVAERNR